MAYYTFNTYTSGGVTLKVIKTSPRNVSPKKITDNTVVGSGYYGMNAGFFDDQIPHPYGINSICATNGAQVGSSSVWENGYRNLGPTGELARGTLVWDDTNRRYYLSVVKNLSDFGFFPWSQSNWLQGGISMNLQNDSIWSNQAINVEQLPSPYRTDVTRSALLYNSGLNLFLVTTPSGCTAEAFRAAIKACIEPSTSPEGIFLDGAGVPQMSIPEYKTTTEIRQMPAILALSNNVQI